MVSQFRKTPLALFVTSFVGFTASSSLIAHELQEVSSSTHEHANTEVITVTASPMNRTPLESAQPISILAGDELQEQHAHTLGETLAKMPGVNATHFAGVASSPIIRGLDGPRVKITQNGLDSGDVSRGSPDHAVTTETSVAEQIEVFRGPATLLYGSGAIGGVVNVVDNRIAKDFVGGVRGFYGLGGDTASNRREMTAGVTADHGQSVWHFDAFTRHSGDYDAPTFINEEGESVSSVENSFIDAQGANVGVSYLFESGYLGVSYGRMEQQYGIPGHSHHDHDHDHDHAHDHAHEATHAEGPYADLWQNRVQVHGGWNNPSAAFKQVELRYGFTDYQHQEIEHGVAGTTFGNRQHELRLTATHEAWQGWTGALGYHFFDQEQTAAGAEAYTPDSTTRKHAAFWLLEKEHQQLNWQLGARVEDVQVNERSFTPVSASFGVTYSMNDAWVLSANIAHAQRAPTAAELYSNGAHLATRTYELGLGYELEAVSDHHYHLHQVARAGRVEKANNIDLGIHLNQQRFHFDWTFFYNRIDDFVYGAYTSINHLELHHEHHHDHDHDHEHDHDHAFHEGLPVIAYTQRDVELYGYELNTSYELSEHWTVALFSDYVRAKTRDGGENLPRIPAQRFGSDLRYQAATWETTLSYIWYNKQNRISHGESVTDSFGLLNAQVNWFPTQLANHNLSVYLKAENLTDELGLVHNSFLKEYAPMRGRNLSIGIRGEF